MVLPGAIAGIAAAAPSAISAVSSSPMALALASAAGGAASNLLSKPIVRQVARQVASDVVGSATHYAVDEAIPNGMQFVGNKLKKFKPTRKIGNLIHKGVDAYDNSEGGAALRYIAKTTGGIIGHNAVQGKITRQSLKKYKQNKKSKMYESLTPKQRRKIKKSFY